MSTQPQLSPLEELAQSQPQASAASSSGLSPLEQLAQSPDPTKAARPEKAFDVGKALGGMHGGSYDIAFHDPSGQISPTTINAEAVGGTVGDALSGVALAAPEVVPKIVQRAKAVAEWAKSNPIKSVAIAKIADELGIHPFDLMHSVVKYGKNLFGVSEPNTQ